MNDPRELMQKWQDCEWVQLKIGAELLKNNQLSIICDCACRRPAILGPFMQGPESTVYYRVDLSSDFCRCGRDLVHFLTGQCSNCKRVYWAADRDVWKQWSKEACPKATSRR